MSRQAYVSKWAQIASFGTNLLRNMAATTAPAIGDPAAFAVYEYAERHGIPVMIHQATTFPAEAPLADVVTRHTLAEGRPHRRVLLAEDNPVNQMVAAAMLRKRGHLVTLVNNGREAVDAVAGGGPFDVVLMEIQMPELDGVAATRGIRSLPAGGGLPISEATRAALVSSDRALNDHVRPSPPPGHTPDHFAVCAGKGSDAAVFTGDLIHSPIQARYPDLVMRVDTDRDQAVRTRRSFLERYCDTDTLCCTMHFPSPSVGHNKRWGDGFRLEYAKG